MTREQIYKQANLFTWFAGVTAAVILVGAVLLFYFGREIIALVWLGLAAINLYICKTNYDLKRKHQL